MDLAASTVRATSTGEPANVREGNKNAKAATIGLSESWQQDMEQAFIPLPS
jgi:hypothetical protein